MATKYDPDRYARIMLAALARGVPDDLLPTWEDRDEANRGQLRIAANAVALATLEDLNQVITGDPSVVAAVRAALDDYLSRTLEDRPSESRDPAAEGFGEVPNAFGGVEL